MQFVALLSDIFSNVEFYSNCRPGSQQSVRNRWSRGSQPLQGAHIKDECGSPALVRVCSYATMILQGIIIYVIIFCFEVACILLLRCLLKNLLLSVM